MFAVPRALLLSDILVREKVYTKATSFTFYCPLTPAGYFRVAFGKVHLENLMYIISNML